MPEPVPSNVRQITIEDRLNTYRREHGRHEMVGLSEPMLKMYELLDQIGSSHAKVLIYGENGTGKERVARAIQDLYGNGAKVPFVALNCSEFPDGLLESMLFGHKRGAFTGAVNDQTGLFVYANGGILFLDEIAEMPPHLQTKLLRVLEDGEVRPIGYNKPIKVDVRVISATNANLAKAISESRFRQDLYYRLNAVEINVPALRERTEDIRPLAEYFNLEFSAKNQRYVRITEDGFSYLQTLAWPGNVRELKNFMERAVILNTLNKPMDTGYFETLPIGDYERAKQIEAQRKKLDLLLPLKEVERVLVARALKETNGNKPGAAKLLGISTNTLYKKLNRMGRPSGDELDKIAATPLYNLNPVSSVAYSPAYAENDVDKPRFVRTRTVPALTAPADTIDISAEGSIARALATHYGLDASARRDESEKIREETRKVGNLVSRLKDIGEQLLTRQDTNGPNNQTVSGNTKPLDYFSHRFYQEAPLIEIIYHIRSERVRLRYKNFREATKSLGIGYYGLRRAVYVPLKTIKWKGDKPEMDSQSFYETATEAEIKRNIASNRYSQLRTIRATEKSLGVTTSTLNKLLKEHA